ncbi:Aste57867_18440 [Aphanomyces stellatus]|uniref:Aste57867_18440 protein n=1 Tax=Aphanomyces stellatus TaxID=120398 RepID=A0A485LDU6_9STRA|nr:hypothetical protein As57867_018378 [Aphanomyces stellatus]VFT95176.1 Aste57867_18440 [Aphanomyces stellatus]
MGASASVKYRTLESRTKTKLRTLEVKARHQYTLLDETYHVHERIQHAELRCHALLVEAVRRGELTRQQLRVVVAELQAREAQFVLLAHEKLQPILDTLQPYYDKYEPVVKHYVKAGVKHTKRAVKQVDDAVTTVVLQAMYQARRQVVSQMSIATISTTFDIPLLDVIAVQISKRTYSIQNCGSDLRHQEIEWTCSLTDPKFIAKLFKLQWVPWQPTMTMAVKLTEIYILDVEYYVRNEYAIKVVHHKHLRAGKKWVALDTRRNSHMMPTQWLQRIDFKEREKRSTLFYDLITEAYTQSHGDYVNSQLKAEEERVAAQAPPPPPKRLTFLTPELIKRTLGALAAKITEEDRFIFYTLGEFETYRMGDEDFRLKADLTIGEMYELFEMEKHDERLREYASQLLELGERVAMEVEDVNRGESREEREIRRMHTFDVDVESDDDTKSTFSDDGDNPLGKPGGVKGDDVDDDEDI